MVLVAMGLYGSAYLGWQLRLSDDTATVVKARDLHPKLAIGMTMFFALGGLGGMMSLLMQGKPIFSRCRPGLRRHTCTSQTTGKSSVPRGRAYPVDECDDNTSCNMLPARFSLH